MKALILVDLQNDLLPGGAVPVPGSEAVIPLANQLQGRFRFVVATQDWHPPHHGCFAGNHPGRAVGEVIWLAKLPQILQPAHCVQHTRGAELAPGLLRRRLNRVFKRGTDPLYDSRSAFFDLGHEQSTGLNDYLQGRGVTQVFVLGLPTEEGVKFTALDAVGLGFKAFVIADACCGRDAALASAALEEMKKAGVSLVQSQDILDASRWS
jgi:nicotinamidase/pyrazinamidase